MRTAENGFELNGTTVNGGAVGIVAVAAEAQRCKPKQPISDTPCAAEPDAFFAITKEEHRVEALILDPAAQIYKTYDTAKRICAQCPIVRNCLEFAIQTPEPTPYGMYGGAPPSTIADLRRLKGSERARAIEHHLSRLQYFAQPKQPKQTEQAEQPERVLAVPAADELRGAAIDIIMANDDSEDTSVYYEAAATLLGFPDGAPEIMPAPVLLNVARDMLRDGHHKTRLSSKYGINFGTVSRIVNLIEQQAKVLPEEVIDKLVDRRSPNEILDYEVGSPDYIEAARRILGINGWRTIPNFDCDLWLDVLRDKDIHGFSTNHIATKYGISHPAITMRTDLMRKTLESLPGEVVAHLYDQELSEDTVA